MARRRSFNFLFCNNSILSLTVGIVCGFLIGQLIFNQNASCQFNKDDEPGYRYIRENNKKNNKRNLINMNNFTAVENLLLIGVMTARIYLHNRVIAINQTWGSDVPGKIIFFTSEGSIEEETDALLDGIDVVELKGVDDSYPPQKKSFLMLKYMHDHYKDKFKFFMRADDDIYVKTDELAMFLNSLDAENKTLYIGQAGLGNKHEFGHLYLKQNENFCMGGPGIILSRETLIRLVPNIGTCLKNLYTTHEDVELGRCIGRYVGVSCSWAYEMQKIFYNNYEGPFTSSLNKRLVNQAITLHPFKNTSYLYHIHHYFLSRKVAALRNKMAELSRDVKEMNLLLGDGDDVNDDEMDNSNQLNKLFKPYIPKEEDEVIEWDYMTSEHVYSSLYSNPRRKVENALREATDDIVDQILNKMNDEHHQRFRLINLDQLVQAYYRLDPLYGPQYIFHLLLKRQNFTLNAQGQTTSKNQFFRKIVRGSQPFVHSVIKIEDGDGGAEDIGDVRSKRCVHFILPLSGRWKAFMQFINNFQNNFLETNENVSLMVMLFINDGDHETETDNVTTHLEFLKIKYPLVPIKLHQLRGQFNRGHALFIGSSYHNDDDLLLFMDVDVLMSMDALLRVRLNTIAGKQVYCPIVFSQYDPSYSCLSSNGCYGDCHDDVKNISRCHGDVNNIDVNNIDLHSDMGYWREFGYGIVSTFKRDFVGVGGFNLSIQGWGKEDVDLVERYIQHKFSIFRSVDLGLVHAFHPIICDDKLDPSQFKMCIGSKASSFASVENLAKYILKRPEVFNLTTVNGGGWDGSRI